MASTLPSSPGPGLSRKERKKAKKKQKRRQDAILQSTEKSPVNDGSPQEPEDHELLYKQWEERETQFQEAFRKKSLQLKEKEARETEYRKRKETAALLREEQRLIQSIERPETDSRNCPFYMKVGCCRYGEACSKFHPTPETSHTLLFKNMYSWPGLVGQSDEDNDMDIQFNEDDILTHFLEFWTDIVPEFEKFGEVQNLRICRNVVQHLRGNVYVSYKKSDDAEKACNMTGRFYEGKQIFGEYCPVMDWSKALCGMYSRNECERGDNCNFLHVFKNPGGKYTDDTTRPSLEKRPELRRPAEPLKVVGRDHSRDGHERYHEQSKEGGRHDRDRRYDPPRDRRYERDQRHDHHRNEYERRDRDDRRDADDRRPAYDRNHDHPRRRDDREEDYERRKRRHTDEPEPQTETKKRKIDTTEELQWQEKVFETV